MRPPVRSNRGIPYSSSRVYPLLLLIDRIPDDNLKKVDLISKK